PHVQFIERRQSVTIRTANQLKHLALENRRSRMIQIPGCGVNDELHAHELHSIGRGLINQGFWFACVDQSVPDISPVYVVDAHCAMVGTGDASQERSVSGPGCGIDVDESLRSVADELNEFRRSAAFVRVKRRLIIGGKNRGYAGGSQQACCKSLHEVPS